jgi:subtilisin family serine protease
MARRGFLFVLVFLVLTAGTAYAAAPNDPGWSQQWHLRTIHADKAWTKSKGAGIIVAVVDTGVDLSHPDLQGRIFGGIDLVDPGTAPDDEQGHGTFMAGLIAADTGNADGVASVAPLAKIMPVRVLNEKGTGDPSVVADGIDWAVAHGADVINLSLAQEATDGSGSENLYAGSAMDKAIKRAAASGAVVVAAAGNGFDVGGAPATSYVATVSGVIVVGASTKSDRRAAYSNYGPGLDVLAPGGGSSSNPSKDPDVCQSNSPIVSTWWNKSTGSAAYGTGCGTSMGAAHVSGIAALLRARGYSNGSAVRRIEATSIDLYTAGRDNQSGYGRVDSAAAVGAISSAPAPKPKAKPRTQTRRRPAAVGAAGGAKPAVKGTKIVPPATSAVPTPIQNLALASAGPFESPLDPKLHLVAFALALAVGVGVAQAMARQRPRDGAMQRA